MGTIKKYLANKKRVGIEILEGKDILEEAKKIHNLTPIATNILGKVLMLGTIMGNELPEEEDSITIQLKGSGPIGNVVCVAESKPTVKGYVWNAELDLPVNKENEQISIGKEGLLYIIKDLGLKEPYVGITPLVNGDVEETFLKYFKESEQTESLIKFDMEKVITYFVSFLPGATEDDKNEMKDIIEDIDKINKKIMESEFLEEKKAKYECNCNREKFKDGIASLKKEDLKEIFEKEDRIETTCQFCNKKYKFEKNEFNFN